MTAATSSGKRPASLLFFLVWFCIRVWAVCSCTILITHGLSQLHAGWTDGAGHPFCEDFLNLWSAGFLLLHHHLMVAYNFEAFHHFQIGIVHHAINLYHYSYPPVTALLSIPFGLLPYPLACVLWQGGGWLAFALVLRRITPKHWCLLALAWPAVFVNTLSGQTGCWIAAIIGHALLDLRDNQTIRAGLLLSLLVAKPQLGWIVPLALLSGREWKALFTMAVGSVGLLALSIMVAGIQPWFAWHERLSILRRIILEDGSGVMQRMMSVFVLVRHAGASVDTAWLMQAAATLLSVALLMLVWNRTRAGQISFPVKASVLVLAILTASPYVSDYDCVMLAFSCVWLWPLTDRWGRIILGMAALSPIMAAGIALGTGIPLAAVFLWAAYIWAVIRVAGLKVSPHLFKH
ncbi:MAG: glycosyltransferase family 87 protein [Acetobacter sp.]|uniref:glycosyltransferase family 87 protein n=1 Tax=Acetobacter sp. TaxID=440 RepID=UPI0039ECFCED